MKYHKHIMNSFIPIIHWLRRKSFVYTLLALVAIPCISIVFGSTAAYADSAKWEGSDLIYDGHKYEKKDHGDINDEIWQNIKDDHPLMSDTEAAKYSSLDREYTFYQWQEDSGCKDTIGFPPGSEAINKRKQAVWWKVDSSFFHVNCQRKTADTITIDQATQQQGTGGTGSDISLDCDSSKKTPDGKDPCDKPKCNVQYMGWIICQISRVIGYTMQGVFWVLEKLMITPPLTTSTSGGNKLYEIWQTFRNIANVVLIIVFLAIVLSQVSSIGISNYGVKRLMPRLVIGAILINSSYFICSILVDTSNVLGHGIFDLLVSIAYPVRPQQLGFSGAAITTILAGAAGVWLYMNILALAPLLVSGIFAIFTTIVVLVIRQALIIMFVVLSPIAFALNIMPSTQQWFGKWWSNFLTILMIFPMVAAVFGGSQVMAGVISAGTPAGTNDLMKMVFTVLSLAVQIIPFFVVPILIKVSGRLVNRFTGIVNNPSKGLFDRAKNRVGEWGEDKEKVRETNALMGKTDKNGNVKKSNGLYAKAKRRSNRRDTIAKAHEEELKNPNKGVYGEFMSSEENRKKVARAVAKNAGDWGGGSASDAIARRRAALENTLASTSLRINISDVDAGDAMLDNEGYTLEERKKAAEDGIGKDGRQLSDAERSAAIRSLAQEGTLDDMHDLIDQINGAHSSASALQREALAQGVGKNPNSKSAAHLDTQQIRGGADVGGLYNTAIMRGSFNTPEAFASQSSGTLKGLAAHLAAHGNSYRNGEIGNIHRARDTAYAKSKYADKMTSASKRYGSQL